MKHRSIVKWLALCGVVALGLTLTGCYIPPDEISDGTQDITLNNNNLPFATIAPPPPRPPAHPRSRPTLPPSLRSTGTTGAQ